MKQDYDYEICGKDGKVIDDGWASLEAAIEFAQRHDGYSVNKRWWTLGKNGDIHYGKSELVACEAAWERECDE